MADTKKIVLGVVGGGVALAALAFGGGAVWAMSAQQARSSQTFEAHSVDIPVPWPLTEEEKAALMPAAAAEGDAGEAGEASAGAEAPAAADAPTDAAADADGAAVEAPDFEAIALERALARGKHLVYSRYGCIECHGQDFGGGTMIDDPMIGQIFGPNLTQGKGSKVLDYKMADWDRMVRHGIKPDGHPTPMPSTDFKSMSDQELSDIIAYIQSLPAVDREMAPISYGPLGTLLVANGTLRFTAEELPDHQAAHKALPPAPEDAGFGEHIAQVCNGCHGADFSGGPVPGGPPDWPEAANLTPAGPLAKYDLAAFQKLMLEGQRPDGTTVLPPMINVTPMGKNMTDQEMAALFGYLQGLPAAQ